MIDKRELLQEFQRAAILRAVKDGVKDILDVTYSSEILELFWNINQRTPVGFHAASGCQSAKQEKKRTLYFFK